MIQSIQNAVLGLIKAYQHIKHFRSLLTFGPPLNAAITGEKTEQYFSAVIRGYIVHSR